uniref:Uncharacterized protein n=1 Tax=Lepeophtheirus salmonis TaxID=72036 RepID=A0A0K2T7X5_LEPSM
MFDDFLNNNSLSNVEYFCVDVERAQHQKDRGCRCPFTFCTRTAPIPVSGLSVVRDKGKELPLNVICVLLDKLF